MKVLQQTLAGIKEDLPTPTEEKDCIKLMGRRMEAAGWCDVYTEEDTIQL